MAFMTCGTHWTLVDDKILLVLYPDKQALVRALSGRTWRAILHRADRLGLIQTASLWTAKAVTQLRAAYDRRATKNELLALFPDLTYAQIANKAYGIGIRRPKPALIKVSDPALEAIRCRTHSMGVTLEDLCRRTGVGSFRYSRHRPATKNLVKGIEALGGEITIEWDD